MVNTAVFISGGGSNLQAIINYGKIRKTAYNIKLVISNRAEARGIKRAQKEGIPTLIKNHKDFQGRKEFDQNIHQVLLDNKIELIALAGFMRLLSPWFVKQWKGKILNIHPSILPAFPGVNAQRQAIVYGVKYSGCSVIFVDEGVDSGAIISQAVVPVHDADTELELAGRILKQEHKIFPEALNRVALGEIILQNGKVKQLK